MNDAGAAVRIAAPSDVPALKELWQKVFGDDRTDIDRFFDVYFSPDMTAVIGQAGAPVAAAYIVPVGDLVRPGRAPEKCSMLYAIATHPDCRGRGYGEAVTRTAAILAVKSGYPAVVLKPAEDSLFGFYEKRSSFREFFVSCDFQVSSSELAEPVHRLSLFPVTPGDYRALRSRCLDGAVYIDADERALSYQSDLYAPAGGGLYAITDGGGLKADPVAGFRVGGVRVSFGGALGCAVAEPAGDRLHIKELLLCGCNLEEALFALASSFPAAVYDVRTPLCQPPHGGSPRRFGMILAGGAPAISSHSVVWYGPAFD
jgi:ribosomal protein S18 acetylase RimI-like enzyme